MVMDPDDGDDVEVIYEAAMSNYGRARKLQADSPKSPEL